ncbi:MAG: hypothetical protein QXX68_01795 [Candidatus Pacearchaeota archaeon]
MDLSSIPLLQHALLFVLVYVVTFAILQKTKILGDKVHQINSLVALVIAFIFVSFSSVSQVVQKIVPWVAVAMTIILLFFLLVGFVQGDFSSISPKIKWAIVGIICVFMVGLILWATGVIEKMKSFSFLNNQTISSTIIIVLVVVAVVYVIFSSKGE